MLAFSIQIKFPKQCKLKLVKTQVETKNIRNNIAKGVSKVVDVVWLIELCPKFSLVLLF